MRPTRREQIVKYHTPNEDEDPNGLFVTLEVIEDEERSKARIYPLNTGLSIPPISLVRLKDLEVVENKTFELDYCLKHDLY